MYSWDLSFICISVCQSLLNTSENKSKIEGRLCDLIFLEDVVALKRAVLLILRRCLASEAVQGASLAFQGVDHVHGGHRLPLGVLGVGDSVTDDVLQEDLQHTPGLLIDESRDTFDTTTAGQTTDGWLGDTLDVVTQHLTMTLGATLSQTFTSLSTSRHDALIDRLANCKCFSTDQTRGYKACRQRHHVTASEVS